MVDVLRRHGLIAFMLALAVVSLGKVAANWAGGGGFHPAGAALLMAGIAAAELERRQMIPASVYLSVVRWGGVLGALGFLLWE